MTNDNLKKAVKWIISEGLVSSQRDLAKKIGYNSSSLSQIIRGRVPVSNKFIRRLTEFEPRLNAEWIKTGEGGMLKVGEPSNIPSPSDSKFRLTPTPGTEITGPWAADNDGVRYHQKGDQLLMTVRHVPVEAFQTFALYIANYILPEKWDVETYETNGIIKGNYISFEVNGFSMDTVDRGSFEKGDKVLARELKRNLWSKGIPFNTHPYWIVVTGARVFLKQIVAQDLHNGTLTFHSINSSPEYSDFSIRIEDIRALFLVISKKPKEVSYNHSAPKHKQS